MWLTDNWLQIQSGSQPHTQTPRFLISLQSATPTPSTPRIFSQTAQCNINEHLPKLRQRKVRVFVNIFLWDVSGDQRLPLSFSTKAAGSPLCDWSWKKRFVSFCGSSPTFFTPCEWECRKSIYFPKIAISLVYSMKMSLYQDEKKSHSNLFGACLNVIMRFCCTPAVLIYLRWRWWKNLGRQIPGLKLCHCVIPERKKKIPYLLQVLLHLFFNCA